MIYRIDVRTRDGSDPVGVSVGRQIAELGKSVGAISTSRIFLIDTDADLAGVRKIAGQLLADRIVERGSVFGAGGRQRTQPDRSAPEARRDGPGGGQHRDGDRGYGVAGPARCGTGRAFVIAGEIDRAELQRIASRVLANGVIESVHFEPFMPGKI